MSDNNFFKNIKNFIKKLFWAIILAFIFKIFIADTFVIPSASMENTLFKGDLVLVNKIIFGASSPQYIPFTNISIPNFRLHAFTKPQINDVIVFETTKLSENSERRYLIKRCIALPGDTIRIINKQVFVNGKKILSPLSIQFEKTGILSSGIKNEKIFPNNRNWNQDNYGPLLIPRIGDTLNADLYAELFDDKKFATFNSDLNSYILKEDFYFVLGDNRDNSLDSRFIGLIPEKDIFGKAEFIIWSQDFDIKIKQIEDFFRSVRWKRIFKRIR